MPLPLPFEAFLAGAVEEEGAGEAGAGCFAELALLGFTTGVATAVV